MISQKLYFSLFFGTFLGGISARGLIPSDSAMDESESVIPIKREFYAVISKDNAKEDTYFLRYIHRDQADLLERESNKQGYEELIQEDKRKHNNMSILQFDMAQIEKLLASTERIERCPSVMYCQYYKFDIGNDSHVTREELETIAKSRGPIMGEEAVEKLRLMGNEAYYFDTIVNLKGYGLEEPARGSFECVKLAQDVKKRDASAQYQELNDIMFFFNAPSNLAVIYPWVTQAYMKLDSQEFLDFNILGGPLELSLAESVQFGEKARSGEQLTDSFRLSENWFIGVPF